MKMSEELIQKIKSVTESALNKIGASDVQEKTATAVKFATSQPPEEITLDGTRLVAVTVAIATVFTTEGMYYQHVDDDGNAVTAETVLTLSIVITGDGIKMCKSSFDVIPASGNGAERFVNGMFKKTSLEELTEKIYLFISITRQASKRYCRVIYFYTQIVYTVYADKTK